MPRISLPIFSVISAWARAISSRTRSCTLAVTSWIAWPSSDGRGSVIARDRPEDLREQERARERGAHEELGAVRSGGGPGAAGAVVRGGRTGGGGRARRGGRADPGRGHRGSRHRTRGRRARGRALGALAREALGLVGLLARALGLGGGRLGLLARLALLARQLLGLLLGGGDLLLDAAHVRLGGDLVDLGDARLALGARGLGRRLARGRRGLCLLGRHRRALLGRLGAAGGGLARGHRARALGLGRGPFLALVRHSGGSSPNARTQIKWAILDVAIVASEPRAASSPDHMRRLTISLSVMVAGVKQTTPMRAPRARRRSCPPRSAWPLVVVVALLE